MRRSWLYLATRSVRESEPVLICPALVATARSAMNVSSVSPERCEIIEWYPDLRPSSIASIVSVTLPIWFSLIRIAFAMPSMIPRASRSVFVTKRSSPTSWIFFFDDLLPMLCVRDFHPAQSSSAMPSSMDTIGYFSAHFVQYAAISLLEWEDLSDFLNTYLPLALSKNSLEAGSSAMLTCSPVL